MATQTENGAKTFTATSAVEAYRAVKLTAGSGTAVEYAGANEGFIGITQRKAAAGELVPVAIKGGNRTFKIVAGAAIAIQADLATGANGKFATKGQNDTRTGTNLEAATADGDVIEALLV